MRWLTKLFVLLIIALLAAGAASIYAWRWLHQPINGPLATIEVVRGASVTQVAQQLAQAGWLSYPRLWSWWARYQQISTQLKAGEYALSPGLSPDALLHLLTNGSVMLRSFTIVEGSTYAELRRNLAQRADIKQTLAQVSDAQIMQTLGLPDMHPEAQFFPDTYHFAKGIRDLDLLRLAQQRMQQTLNTLWATRSADSVLSDPYQALILASIVEKETALASERPLIAGVFVERLLLGMRLQTDPTVIYGMGEAYHGNLRKADLLRNTPYNTYTRLGLPPTPICLPGAAALQAAMQPQRTGALYFVATGKADGSHYFSRTLAEHNAAVRRYLKTVQAQ